MGADAWTPVDLLFYIYVWSSQIMLSLPVDPIRSGTGTVTTALFLFIREGFRNVATAKTPKDQK